jgi:hypothetical protein
MANEAAGTIDVATVARAGSVVRRADLSRK